MSIFRKFASAAAVLSLALISAGCGSSGTTAGQVATGGDPVTTGGPLVAGGATSIYVVQNNTLTANSAAFNTTAADNVLKFSASASGTATPTSAFSGPTGVFIAGVTTDSTGNIYAAGSDSTGAGQILVYSASATGTATPLRTIAGASTGLGILTGIALDSAGQIYVSSYAGPSSTSNSVSVFAANATGNVAPLRKISGALTALAYPNQLVVDSTGTVYVADGGVATVSAFASTASGNVLPTRTFTTIAAPSQIGIDSSNNLYLALGDKTGNYGAVNVFPSTASGNLPAPARVVGGSALNAYYLEGVTTDAKNNIYTVYVSNSGTLGVATFSPTASGNATPASTFTTTAYSSSYYGYIAVR